MYSYTTVLSIFKSQNKIVPLQLVLVNNSWGFDLRVISVTFQINLKENNMAAPMSEVWLQ